VSFTDTWQKATIDGSDNTSPPPEGKYEVALIDASAFVSKKGTEIAKLEFRVVSVNEQGHEWVEIRSFATQGAANAAKATCHRLGVEVDQVGSLEELDGALKSCVGSYYAVNVVRKGEYLNTYVEEATKDAPDETGFKAAAPDSDDDVPF
jgi:hypothetical protein